MTLREYVLQSDYCKTNNTPEGEGCDNCPATDRDHCADALVNLCGKWLETTGEEREKISRDMDINYGITPISVENGWKQQEKKGKRYQGIWISIMA